ncbi:hypothetical protein RDWZM_007654 [Blomia tropicalis]|uniref:SMB domain-containing protein n=1 Tax=Blomia tropicalis TaxID=40697 RepID=A0A9Q0M2Z8_BLOTA|nr:hypothetical protein RDWZM_007654 [Blomia tropicalis]
MYSLLGLFLFASLTAANPYKLSSTNNFEPNSIVAGGSCRERNLCCSGRDRSCAISTQIGGSISILGNLITAADNSGKECYCDSACITLGDCCPDYKDTCGVIDCRVSEWDQWSDCDVSCGVGSMSRSRTILSQPQNGGKECPDLHQKRACHGQRCEVQDNDKMVRETAIVLLSSFSSTRNVDEEQDIRRNLRLNYPKDPLKENVNEYTVLFEVNKNAKKSCESFGSELYSKMQEGSKVCVQCQEAAMRRHLGYRCYGHGSVGKSTRWTALGNVGCHGRWTRLDDTLAANYCGGTKNGTSINKNEPDFIFV